MSDHMTIKNAIRLVERRANYLKNRIADREKLGLVCNHERAEQAAIHKLLQHVAILEANYVPPSRRVPAPAPPSEVEGPTEETLQAYRDLAAGKRPRDDDEEYEYNSQPCPT